MESIAVKQIAVDPTGRLLVRPEKLSAAFPYVYRTAAGVRWDSDAQAFVATAPDRWEHAELAAHIVRVVLDECGVSLFLSPHSEWSNLTQEEQAEIRGALEGGANAV